MSDVKGGSGLRGREKQQSTLRDVRSGAYDKGGPSQAPDPNEAQRTEHQRAQWGASAPLFCLAPHSVKREAEEDWGK